MSTRKELREATAKAVNALTRKELLEQFRISRVAELTGLDNAWLPVYTCVRPASKTVAIHAGKGLDRESSRAGAILEAIEFEVSENPVGDWQISRASDMEPGSYVPLDECFPTRSSILNELTPMAWEEVVNVQNGVRKLIPSDLVWMDTRIKYQPLMYVQSGSNGIASGGSLEDAILSGLYEIIERDAWTLNQYLLDSGFLLHRTPLTEMPSRVETCVRQIDKAGLKVHIFDISNDYQIPVFSALILDLSGNCAGTFGGYGAHLNAEIAVLRAITEAAQARCCYISGARDDMFRRQFLLMKRMDQHKLNNLFNELPMTGPISEYRVLNFPDVKTELRYLLKLIRQFGVSDVYVKDMGSYVNGAVHVVRVISPQCEPFRFDHWMPGLRCLSYAQRRINELVEASKSQEAEEDRGIMEGNIEPPEMILVYLGPSLSLAKAKAILPDAVYRPPAKQGDIATDVVNFRPARIILIDGYFRENLSVWHKELVYALQFPGVKAIYGAASMGALRAAELDYLGMIGIGKIYGWYRDAVTEDDSEVALSFAEREGPDGPIYYPSTVPLVDIRAGVEQVAPELREDAREFLEEMRAVFYMDRTPHLCAEAWGRRNGTAFPHIDQKMIDARTALTDYLMYEPEPLQKPSPDNLSKFFQALYERDRKINVNGTAIPQQHIDAYVLLHNPEYERICWDSANQDLALMLCDHLCVMVTIDEIERENVRFQLRSGIETIEDFETFLSANGWSRNEYDRLMITNARIRKLQHANTVTKMYRRNTLAIINYLRTHQGFDYWAKLAVESEKEIQKSGVDDWLGVNLETPAFQLLAEHCEKEGLELKCNNEEYLLETGFSNLTELGVALARITAGKEHHGD